jgi:hypothetical protein
MDILNSIETCCEAKVAQSPSLLDTLKRRQKDAEERLAVLNAAIKALEENPQVAQVLELVARAR